MSEKRFLQTLQALLTMVDPDDPTSAACVKSTLENLFALGCKSNKCDAATLHMIEMAIRQSRMLIIHHSDFASVKGEYDNNVAKLHRLKLVLQPGC